MELDPNCPACGGMLELLGILSDLAHLRCRHCGMDSSQTVETGDADSDEEN